MTAKKILKIDRSAPYSAPANHNDNRGEAIFDAEVSKIRREGYDERMKFTEVKVKKKVKTPAGEKMQVIPVTEVKVSRRKWEILQEIRLRNSHD